jgi:drug/metabolite transporter (DMT)-like permease
MPRGLVTATRAPRVGTGGRARSVALLVGAAASWGIGTVVSKQAVAELPALTLLIIQLSVSVAVMAAVVRARGEQLPASREGRLLGRLGLLNPGLAYALSLVGLTGITASLAVLLWAMEPILILILAAIVLGERTGRLVIVASAVAIAGLVLVVADPAAGGSTAAVALTIAGVVVCALYTVLTRRWLLGTDATFPVVLSQQLFALGLIAIVVVIAAATGQPVIPARLSFGGIASAAISGLLYYALAYSCYLTALRNVSAPIAASAFYLIPVFGLAGAFVAGERLGAEQWAGAAVVVAAVVVITTRIAQAPQPSSADPSAQIPMRPIEANRS